MTFWIISFIALPSAVWFAGLLQWLFKGQHSGGHRVSNTGAVVVARNEEKTIRDCLISLSNQSSPLNEIVLHDDASTDHTLEIAEEMARTNTRIRVKSHVVNAATSSPKKSALSSAFRNSDCEFIALTDADCSVPEKWVECMSSAMDDNTGVVIGASWPQGKVGFGDRVYRAERLVANTLMASACGWGSPASACGHSILYRTKAVLEIDGPVHRELPSGDDDLTVQAIARSGWSVKFCKSPDSVVQDLAGVRGSRLAQAARHQSVTRLYPVRWRILFAFSIVANILALFAIFWVAFSGFTMPIASAVAIKIVLDILSGYLAARQLQLDISLPGIALAAVLLPFWTIWRAVAAFTTKQIQWRGRQLDVAPAPSNLNGI